MEKSSYKFIPIGEMEALASELDQLIQEGNKSQAKSKLESILKEYKCNHVDELRSEDNRLGIRYCWRNWTLLHSACQKGCINLVKYLVADRKINVDLLNNFDQTPLTVAAKVGHIEVVKFLTNHGANIHHLSKSREWQTKKTFTPLLHACGTGAKCDEVIRFLLQRKSDPKVKTFRTKFWPIPEKEFSTETYTTTLHLLIISSIRARDKINQEKLLGLIEEVIISVPQDKRKGFLEAKTRYVERPDLPFLSTLELSNMYMDACDSKNENEIEFWRSVQDILYKYGADRDVLNDKCDSVGKRLRALEESSKKLESNGKKSPFDKIQYFFGICSILIAPKEAISFIFSIESVHEKLKNKYININDPKVQYLIAVCIAIVICSVICMHYKYYENPCTKSNEVTTTPLITPEQTV